MYNDFSMFYDAFTKDVDYKKRTKLLLTLFDKFDTRPTLLLDLACGTGAFSVEFAKRKIGVIGVDISESMLGIAANRATKENLDILFLCQDAAKLDLYGTVDGAVCCLDSLNHILDYKKLCRAISKVSLFLEKDRLFIFDMNTVYKHKEVLANNTFVFEENGIFCCWQNQYSEKNKTTEMRLDFFEKDGDTYNRFSDTNAERAYSEEEIENAINAAGLKLIATFDENGSEPKSDSQRLIYVTRKV